MQSSLFDDRNRKIGYDKNSASVIKMTATHGRGGECGGAKR
jgi:hypothetical protein